MAKAGLSIKINGFEEILKQIEKAGGSIDKSVEVVVKQSANIVQDELKSEMKKANVSQRLINAMPPPQLFKDGNAYVAKVGYEKGEYNPDNLSDGYKVVFLNYGTPHRTKHGKIKARGFIQKAKKNASKKIKKLQEETFNEILERLKR